MAATQQSAAVNAANQLFNLMQQMRALRQACTDYATEYGDLNLTATLNAFATAPANADGSLGTADGTPNNAHPIDTRVIAGLQSDRSANDYANAETAVSAFVNFCGNVAVPTLNRNAVIDLFIQG